MTGSLASTLSFRWSRERALSAAETNITAASYRSRLIAYATKQLGFVVTLLLLLRPPPTLVQLDIGFGGLSTLATGLDPMYDGTLK